MSANKCRPTIQYRQRTQWDYEVDPCMYIPQPDHLSIIPLPSDDIMEQRIYRHALNLETCSNVSYSLQRILKIEFPLEHLQKFQVRKLAGNFLYNLKTADLALAVIEQIKKLERIEMEKNRNENIAPKSLVPVENNNSHFSVNYHYRDEAIRC